MYFTVTLWR